MPHARSVSGSCSAAWSNQGSESRPERRSRVSSTTSISTGTSCSRRTRGRESSSSTVASAPQARRDSVSGERRLLILAEGYSADPHYGKTARGVIRYRPEQVVAILDSQRVGETHEGIPVVENIQDGLRFGPTTALVGVATQGGRFPAAWRALLRSCISQG